MLPHSWIEPQVMWKVQFLGFFLNKPPLFAQKDHFLRYFLNWPPPKNPYWKIEPRGSIRADTVIEIALIKNSVFFMQLHYCKICANQGRTKRGLPVMKWLKNMLSSEYRVFLHILYYIMMYKKSHSFKTILLMWDSEIQKKISLLPTWWSSVLHAMTI